MSSGALLERSLAIGEAGTAMGFQVTKTIASLKQKFGPDSSLHSLDSNVLYDLTNVTLVAHTAARLAARAELDIRKIIGRPDSPANRHIWSTRPTSATLIEIEQQLRQLGAQITLAAKTSSVHHEEMATIESGILSMLGVAVRNTVVASEAAAAAERLHIHAINFVRVVERSGLFLSSGQE